MREFTSLEQAFEFIELCNYKTLQALSKDMTDIMRQQIQDQVYNAYSPSQYQRTGQLGKTPHVVNVTKNEVEVEFEDNGDWISYAGANKGNHFFPLYGLEIGKTWGKGGYRPATEIMNQTLQQLEIQLPQKYKKLMSMLLGTELQ